MEGFKNTSALEFNTLWSFTQRVNIMNICSFKQWAQLGMYTCKYSVYKGLNLTTHSITVIMNDSHVQRIPPWFVLSVIDGIQTVAQEEHK